MSAISALSYVRSLTFSKQGLALSLIPSIVIPIISKRLIASRISNPQYELIQGFFSLGLTFAILQFHSRAWIINAIFATILCAVGNRLSNRFGNSHELVWAPHIVLSHEIKPLFSGSEAATFQPQRYLALCQEKVNLVGQEACRNSRKMIRNELWSALTDQPRPSPSMNFYFEHENDVYFWKEGNYLKINYQSIHVASGVWKISIDPDGNTSYENNYFTWTKEATVPKDGYRIAFKKGAHRIYLSHKLDPLSMTVEEYLEWVELFIEQLCFRQKQVKDDLCNNRNRIVYLSLDCLKSTFRTIRRNRLTTFWRPFDLFCQIIGLKPSFKAQILKIPIWSPVASSAFAIFEWEIRCDSNGNIHLTLLEKLDRSMSKELSSLSLKQDRDGQIFIQTLQPMLEYRMDIRETTIYFYDLKSKEVFTIKNDETLTDQDQKPVEAEKQKALEKILKSLTLFYDILKSPASVILGERQAFNFQGQQILPEQLEEATKLNSFFRERFHGDNLPIYQFLSRNLYKGNPPKDLLI